MSFPIETCPKCGAQGAAFICSTPGCPVNGGAAYSSPALNTPVLSAERRALEISLKALHDIARLTADSYAEQVAIAAINTCRALVPDAGEPAP